MAGFDEQNTVQSMVVETLAGIGDARAGQPARPRPVRRALRGRAGGRAAPAEPRHRRGARARIDEVLRPLRALFLAAATEGVVALEPEADAAGCGVQESPQVRRHADSLSRCNLIDFDDHSNNRFVVSRPLGHLGRATEVTYRPGLHPGRSAFDLVLWVNGSRWWWARRRRP